MIFMSSESQYATFLLVFNSNLGSISNRLAAIARTDLHGHSKSIISISSKTAYATSY